MRLPFLISVLLLFSSLVVHAQSAVETSATTHEVKINEDKKIKTSGGEARVKQRKGKSIRKDKPERKRHRSHSEAGVFKRHNHFKSSSARSRERGTRKNAPDAPKK
jgi:hypothetical protein